MAKLFFADVSPLGDEALYGKYFDTLSEERRKKILSYRFKKDRLLSLGAGVLLESFAPHGAEISLGGNGKPYFPDFPDIHFNISHSGTKVAVCIAKTDVGCDTEQIAKADMKLAKRFFCKSEYEFIENCPDRDTAFYRIWTLKESFMKCTGLGMSLPLDAFSILIENGKALVNCPKFEGQYRFFEFDTIKNYRLAVCLKGSDEAVEIAEYSF